jgi:hypothetical protein
MSFWDKLKNPGTLVGGPIGGLIYDQLDIGGEHAQDRLDEYGNQQAGLRAGAKKTQYDLLGQMKRPLLTPQMEARIKALESESQLPLNSDPAFQSQVRQATTGGAQALSGIQNRQAASGAEGGFSNVGSINDVYDRLGTQLADLAQKQTMYKEKKRDTASELRQSISDAQISYDNALTQAKIAIEAGDAAATQQALAQAYAAREQINNNSRQLLLGMGSMAVGALTGGMGGGAPKTVAPSMDAGGGDPYLDAPSSYSIASVNNIGPRSYNDTKTFAPFYQSASYRR